MKTVYSVFLWSIVCPELNDYIQEPEPFIKLKIFKNVEILKSILKKFSKFFKCFTTNIQLTLCDNDFFSAHGESKKKGACAFVCFCFSFKTSLYLSGGL